MISRCGSAHLDSCFVASLGLLVLCVTGCSSKGRDNMVPINGKVIYNNGPLSEGTIVYLPAGSRQSRQATGQIQQDGTFVLTTFEAGDGAMFGEYNIIIYAYKPHPGEPKTRGELEAMGGRVKRGFIIPERYTKSETSGLGDKVDENHPGYKLIELED